MWWHQTVISTKCIPVFVQHLFALILIPFCLHTLYLKAFNYQCNVKLLNIYFVWPIKSFAACVDNFLSLFPLTHSEAILKLKLKISAVEREHTTPSGAMIHFLIRYYFLEEVLAALVAGKGMFTLSSYNILPFFCNI